MSDTTFYYVPGMMYPYWAVTADNAVNLDSDTDMGDLDTKEFTEHFMPRAKRIPKEIAWSRRGEAYLGLHRNAGSV
jgi:hypothetical protein